MKLSFRVAVMTVPRTENYIYRFLDGFPSEIRARLVVGSTNSAYLQKYTNRKNLEVLAASTADWATIEPKQVHHRAVWNYWRCLQLGAKGKRAGGLLILEDDVLLSYGWAERLERTIQQIRKRHGERFVLSLYVAWRRLTPERPGDFYAEYAVNTFFGTQGIYYPEPIRADFMRQVQENAVGICRDPYDILLKRYLYTRNIPLFVTVPCLVQHIGLHSTGLGDFHLARDFAMNISPRKPGFQEQRA